MRFYLLVKSNTKPLLKSTNFLAAFMDLNPSLPPIYSPSAAHFIPTEQKDQNLLPSPSLSTLEGRAFQSSPISTQR